MKNFIQRGESIYVAAPGGGAVSGAPYQIGVLFGIWGASEATVGNLCALWREGVISGSKVSAQAWAVGDAIYWDSVALLFTNVAATGLLRVGIAVEIAANPTALGKLDLTPVNLANGTSTIFAGGSTSVLPFEGNLSKQVSAAGVQPGATAADNVLAVYSVPANFFDVAGRGLAIKAEGSFGATGNNKRIKIIVNPATAVVGSTVGASGVTIADTGTVATNAGGWSLKANLLKYGAAASNTQLGLHEQAQVGAATAALLAPAAVTAVESGAILIAVTGNATTAASDIVLNFLEVKASN